MRVVVVGATGNIGTSVVEALAEDQRVQQVDALARRLAPEWAPSKTRFIAANIGSADLVGHFRGADAVVQLAWAFQPTHDPVATWDTNVAGTIRAFEAVAAAGVPTLVYASSVGAYAPGQHRVDETWPTHSIPTAAYGREKSYLERYLDAFELRHSNIRVVRIRPCFVFKRQSASEQRRIFAGPFFPRFLTRPGCLPLLPLPDGLRFQAVHAGDVAEVFRLAVVSDVRGAFNVAAEPEIDHLVLQEMLGARAFLLPARMVGAATGAAWRLRLVPADAGLLQLMLSLPTLDTSRTRSELGWEPRYTGIETLRELLDGLADGAGMATPPLTPDRLSAGGQRTRW